MNILFSCSDLKIIYYNTILEIVRDDICKMKRQNYASAIGGTGHIPLPHPPPMPSKLAIYDYTKHSHEYPETTT